MPPVIAETLFTLTKWLQPYYSEVATIVLATLLVIYGDRVNKHIKQMLAPYHFVVRTLVFMLVCAFGYGALMVLLAPYLKQAILLIPSTYQGICILAGFLFLGYLAENRRYI